MTGQVFVKVSGHFVNVERIVEIFTAYSGEKGVYQVLMDCGITDFGQDNLAEVPHCLIAWSTQDKDEAEQVAGALAAAIGTVMEPVLKELTPGKAPSQEVQPTWPKVMDLVEFVDRDGVIDPTKKGKSHYVQIIALGSGDEAKQAVKVRLVLADPNWIREHDGGWEIWVYLADLRALVKGRGMEGPKTWPQVGEEVEFLDRDGRIKPRAGAYKATVQAIQQSPTVDGITPGTTLVQIKVIYEGPGLTAKDRYREWVGWVYLGDLRVLVQGPEGGAG